MLASTCARSAAALPRSRGGLTRDGAFSRPGDAPPRRGWPLRRLAEIAVRRGVDAVGAGAEIDAVEIELEDLVLAEHARATAPAAPPGPCGEAALGRQEQVLGELLGDRAAALDAWPAREVDQERADEPERIDAEMAVEAAVLGRDHRLRQVGRHVLQPQLVAEEVAIAGIMLPSAARMVTLGGGRRG